MSRNQHFPSGAVASAAACDEGNRAMAAASQHGDSDMGAAAKPIVNEERP
jgi:hypothetical protein